MADGFINNNHPLMLLRFRPIAPKPISGVAVTPTLPISTRSRRKYLGRRSYPARGRRIRRRDSPKPPVLKKQALLLPGTMKARDRSKATGSSFPLVKSFLEGYDNTPSVPRVTSRSPLLPDLNKVVSPDPTPETPLLQCKRVLETWLIVESVATDARCTHGVGLQQQLGGKMADEERVRSLVRDTCPGFVTDEDNLIRWVNGACERMVRERLSTAGGGVAAVWMVTREDLPYGCPGFTCRVRIVNTWQDEGVPIGRGVTVALCDAWRLESGGFAWRLDVEASLSLAPAKAGLMLN